MLTDCLAKDSREKVGCAVDDPRLLLEVGIRVDHTEKLDYTGNPIKILHFALQGTEAVECGELSRLVSCIHT